ncbi:hypothetical protein TWF481_011070 [Arthrobotrys musiformis]|uniref:Uncharacterized protein n=1 Tax=Arthrobotrys musiformis TaxID=47236 RepID=A0AAV9VXD4_9PEZI
MDPRTRYGDNGMVFPSRLAIGANNFHPPLPEGVIPPWKQRVYTPSSTPPPPHDPSASEVAYYNNKNVFPRGNPEPHFDPVKPTCLIVGRYLNKVFLRIGEFKPGYLEVARQNEIALRTYLGRRGYSEEAIMDAIRRGIVRVGLGDARTATEADLAVNEEEYTVEFEGDYREHARTLMLKMLSKGVGAMHKDKIQRVNEMINDCMLTPWDEVVGIVLWNLSRTNPFVHQTATTMYLEGLFRGFRDMWLKMCVVNQGQIDFAEAVCRQLYKHQAQVPTMDLDILALHAKTFFASSHGFWLYNYRLYRDNIGHPLGMHCEHTLMDREKAPKMLIDYILTLMNNKIFETDDQNIIIPTEIADAAGSCIKTLTQVYEKEESNEHNKVLIDHFARNMLSASRQKLVNYCRIAEKCLSFDDVV